jgi:predicted component of type VI protein secretion system
MTVSIKIFTKAAGRPTLYASRDLDVLPITIGRDAGCTIVVEDPQKHLSRFHVEIEVQDGVYWMEVASKVNPVMVKGRRYGPGTRLTLKSGDSFEMGEYEVHVGLPEEAAAVAGGVDIDLSDPDAIFNEPTFVGGTSASATAPPAPRPAAPKPGAPKPAPPAAQAAPVAGIEGALRLFIEGAGVPHKELPAADAERLLRDSGAVLRAAVEGLMMLLIARAEMRKEMQAEERTMVAVRDNNPLKLMSDPHEAMDFLLDPTERTDGFLDPVQAVGDAAEDLRSHEIALIAAMRAAILGALRRVDPHALERAYDKAPHGFSLASRKSRLWDEFVAQHEKLVRDAQEDFNKVFGRDFMSAYQSQLRRLKGGK